jgi:hemolysin III
MRRLDHSAIFILIAGTYTPYSLAVVEPYGTRLMIIGWAGAAVGLFRSLLWPHAPKFVVAFCYLALGWAPLFIGRPLIDGLGPDGLFWSAVGGVLYSVGALCYALKRPALWPNIFGYHEVLHVFVILAAACHFVAVVIVLNKIS